MDVWDELDPNPLETEQRMRHSGHDIISRGSNNQCYNDMKVGSISQLAQHTQYNQTCVSYFLSLNVIETLEPEQKCTDQRRFIWMSAAVQVLGKEAPFENKL